MTDLDETAVLAANEAFYEAFRARAFGAMEALWSFRDDLFCVHPGWQPLAGREAVLGSWARILSNPANPRLMPRAARAILMGEVACVVCLEVAPEGAMTATNIFSREDGAWRMIGHHAGPIAAASDPGEAAPPARGALH